MTHSSPLAKDMGPIERELRQGWATWHWCAAVASHRVWLLLKDCAHGLGYRTLFEADDAKALFDVMSEAIEAASELGL